MEAKFYTSTEAAEITKCSRRQLQYWRDKGVVIPTVNTTGKGRNVYYSVSELLALILMHYLLSFGLSFEVCREALTIFREKEPWMFDQFFPLEKMKRLMLLTSQSEEQVLKIVDFNPQVALEAICQGQAVIPLWCDRIHELLHQNLKSATQEISKT